MAGRHALSVADPILPLSAGMFLVGFQTCGARRGRTSMPQKPLLAPAAVSSTHVPMWTVSGGG